MPQIDDIVEKRVKEKLEQNKEDLEEKKKNEELDGDQDSNQDQTASGEGGRNMRKERKKNIKFVLGKKFQEGKKKKV